MKKRSKKYAPKYIACNPMATFFGSMSDQHSGHLQVINTRNHAAMAAMVAGKGARADWDMLVGALNMGNVMCEQGIGNEFRPIMLAGRDAMLDVGTRGRATGRFIFKGDELAAMNAAMECHGAQLENIRAIDIDRAADEVTRRLRHGVNVSTVAAQV